MRAHNKGGEWVNNNLGTEPYFNLVSSYTKMNPTLISSMPRIMSDTDVDIESLGRMATLMREHGLLNTGIDVVSKVYKPR